MSGLGATGLFGLTATVTAGAGRGRAAAVRRAAPGTWAVTVTFPDTPGVSPEEGLVAFTADGIVIESNTGSRYAGIGNWIPTASGFSYGWREQIFTATGALLYVVHVKQAAVMASSTSFTSTGTGTAYDPSGNLVASQSSSIAGTRYTLAS